MEYLGFGTYDLDMILDSRLALWLDNVDNIDQSPIPGEPPGLWAPGALPLLPLQHRGLPVAARPLQALRHPGINSISGLMSLCFIFSLPQHFSDQLLAQLGLESGSSAPFRSAQYFHKNVENCILSRKKYNK